MKRHLDVPVHSLILWISWATFAYSQVSQVQLQLKNHLPLHSTIYRWTSQAVDYERDYLYFIEYFAHSHYEFTMIHGPTWTIFKMNLALNQESAFDLSEYVCRIAWDPMTKRLAVAGVKLISTLDLIVGYINVTSGKVDITGNLVSLSDSRCYLESFSIDYQSQFLIKLGFIIPSEFTEYLTNPGNAYSQNSWRIYGFNSTGSIVWSRPKETDWRFVETDTDRGIRCLITNTEIEIVDAMSGSLLQKLINFNILAEHLKPELQSARLQGPTLYLLWYTDRGNSLQKLHIKTSSSSISLSAASTSLGQIVPFGELISGSIKSPIFITALSSLENINTNFVLYEFDSESAETTKLLNFVISTDPFDQWTIMSQNFVFIFCNMPQQSTLKIVLNGMNILMFQIVPPSAMPAVPTKQGNPVRNTQDPNTVLTIVASIIFSFLALVLVAAFIYTRKLKRKSRRDDLISMTSMSAASDITLQHTQNVLSIPGYLEMQNAAEVRSVKLLASGGNGDVYLATALNLELKSRTKGDFVVLKRPKYASPTAVPAFVQELSLMSFLSRKYPYFCEVYAFESKNQMLVMKHYELGSLYHWIRTVPWSLPCLLQILRDVSIGIKAMHRENIAHCDLKPENILIDHDQTRSPQFPFRAVLSDFGLARILTTDLLVKKFQRVEIKGLSMLYAAPEVFEEFHSLVAGRPLAIIKTADIYALGCLVYFCSHKSMPWL